MVFLTGKKEILYLCRRLKLTLDHKDLVGKKRSRLESEESLLEFDEGY